MFANPVLGQVIFRIMGIWLRKSNGVDVRGPLFWENTAHRSLICEIQTFRREENLRRAPYLEGPAQMAIETKLRLDERSAHFALWKGGRILACTRLTPCDYEFSKLHPNFANLEECFTGFWEVGRLCTASDLERKGQYASILLISATIWLFMKTTAKGTVGICREEVLPYLAKMGQRAHFPPATLTSRAGRYYVVHAERSALIRYSARQLTGFGDRPGTIKRQERHYESRSTTRKTGN